MDYRWKHVNKYIDKHPYVHMHMRYVYILADDELKTDVMKCDLMMFNVTLRTLYTCLANSHDLQ